MSAVDFAAAKSVKLSAVISQSLQLTRVGHEFKACCPFHEDRSPSFTVNDQKGFAFCFGCGWRGDAADFVAAIAGCGLREAVERLGSGSLPRLPLREAVPGHSSDTSEAAKRIWREAVPIGGTPAQTYLASRGIWMSCRPRCASRA